MVYMASLHCASTGQGLGNEDIPANVARLAGMLTRVDLSRNRFIEVPPGLLRLGGGLEDLNLGNNQIEDLPAEVSQSVGGKGGREGGALQKSLVFSVYSVCCI